MEAIDKGQMPHTPESPILLARAELRGLTILELHLLLQGLYQVWNTPNDILALNAVVARLTDAVEDEIMARHPETMADLAMQVVTALTPGLIWERGLDALFSHAQGVLVAAAELPEFQWGQP